MNVRSVSLALVLAAVSFGCGSKKSEGDGSVEAKAKDGNATYEVEIRRIGDHGVETFKHKGVAAGAKDRLVFRYLDWKGNGESMKVGVDHGDDGSIDAEQDVGDEE